MNAATWMRDMIRVVENLEFKMWYVFMTKQIFEKKQQLNRISYMVDSPYELISLFVG